MAGFNSLNGLSWQVAQVIDPRLEQIVGENDFQSPWFLRKGLERSKSVGLIPNQGTAFLISTNLIMTNWHVFRRPDWAKDKYVIFDFEQEEDGLPLQSVKVKLNPEGFFYSNEELDYSVVMLSEPISNDRPFIDISFPGAGSLDSRVNIIQHPEAGFKKIAIRENGLKFKDEKILQYWTDTEHGSSGSPLFDDKWNIIGLHYKQDNATSGDESKIYYNEGHVIEAIYNDLIVKNPGVFG